MPFSSDMVKNSIRAFFSSGLPHSAGCGGSREAMVPAWQCHLRQPAGRFIWQLVGVLET